MADIQISYQNVLSKADELDELVRSLERIRDNALSDALLQMDNAWDGTASEEMKGKYVLVIYKLQVSISELRNASSVLRRHANDWYNREKFLQERMRELEAARNAVGNGVNTLINNIFS